jgi:hypothetical protein
MAHASIRQFRDQIGSVVGFLEKGDTAAAAVAATEMKKMIPDLSPSALSDDVEEVRKLLERYAVLGDGLRQQVLGAMNRMGAARRLRAYGGGRRGRRP